MKRRTFTLLGTVIALSASAWAGYDPTNLSNVVASDVDSLLKTVALGAAYRPLAPASTLGPIIGLEIGVQATAVSTAGDFQDAMSHAGVTQNIPSYLPVPRFYVRKGIPGRIDLGFSYVSYQSNRIVAFEGQWSLFKPATVHPDLAIRLTHTRSSLFFMKARTTFADVLVSKQIGANLSIEPYAGTGLQWLAGDLNVSLSGPNSFPVNLSREYRETTGHFFVGVPVNLGMLKLAAEADYCFAGVVTYAAKFGFSF